MIDSEDEKLEYASTARCEKPVDKYAQQLGFDFDCRLADDDYETYLSLQRLIQREQNVDCCRMQLMKWFDKTVHSLFCDNPYTLTLKLVLNTGNTQKPKASSFAFAVIKIFGEWLQQQTVGTRDMLKSMLTEEMQHLAFKLTYQSHALIPIVKRAFHIKVTPRFIADIRKLVHENKYTEASRLIIEYDICNEFEVEDVLMPLLMQNKLQLAKDLFIRTRLEDQQELLVILDRFMSEDVETASELMVHYVTARNIPKCNKGLAKQPDPVSIVTKVIKQYAELAGIPFSDFTNSYQLDKKERLESHLQMFFLKKAEEKRKSCLKYCYEDTLSISFCLVFYRSVQRQHTQAGKEGGSEVTEDSLRILHSTRTDRRH